jgi:hypothetical protein
MPEAFSSGLHAFAFRFGRKVSLRGFDVRALMPQHREWSVIRDRLDAALGLLERHARPRYQMLQRDIQRVWVTGIPSQGAFIADRAMCVLDFDFVTTEVTRPEEVALTLIHEGTHARLRRAGFGYDARIRPRIERLCIGSELVVARRLPGAADLADDASQRLAWDDDTWSAESIRGRHIDALQELGWAGRLGYRMAKVVRPSLR